VHLRSGNGPELYAKVVRGWLHWLGVQTLFIEPGSPWDNDYNESFNGKLRDELLDREIFFTLKEAQILIERWRQHYNRIRPHSALQDRTPAEIAATWISRRRGCRRPVPPARTHAWWLRPSLELH
jgi:putative transposase